MFVLNRKSDSQPQWNLSFFWFYQRTRGKFALRSAKLTAPISTVNVDNVERVLFDLLLTVFLAPPGSDRGTSWRCDDPGSCPEPVQSPRWPSRCCLCWHTWGELLHRSRIPSMPLNCHFNLLLWTFSKNQSLLLTGKQAKMCPIIKWNEDCDTQNTVFCTGWIRMNSQSSSCHQRLDIVGVDIQGLIVLVHGFHVSAMFEVIHTWTHTEGTKEKTPISRMQSFRGQTNAAPAFLLQWLRGYSTWPVHGVWLLTCIHLSTRRQTYTAPRARGSVLCRCMWIFGVHPILLMSVLSPKFRITTWGPMMSTVSSELQKQNPPLWRICCKEKSQDRKRQRLEKILKQRLNSAFKLTDLCSPLITDGGWVSLIPTFSSR